MSQLRPSRSIFRSANVVLPALLLILGCSSTRETGSTPEAGTPTNLLLITVDTLRPDRLGHGGNSRNTSPAIDQLATRGLRFQRTYSQAGWTLPSVASILTGRYPRDHGAISASQSLNKEVPTLASILSSAGFSTSALVSHVLLTPAHGVHHGFGRFDRSVLESGNPHKVATAEPLTDRAIRVLNEIESPFFLWVHYFDPHFSYLVHPEWTRYGLRPIDRYDGEIAQTDHHIGRLLEALSARGLDGTTVVAFTSDHGEEFGEHGGKYHFGVEEEVLRVPLILRAPGLEPGIATEVAEQIDLLPTLLALLGVETPSGLPGRDLLQPIDERLPPRPVFVERRSPSPFLQRAVLRGDQKLLRVSVIPGHGLREEEVERRGRRSDVQPGIYLYDLRTDPGEETNLYRPDEPTALELLALLDQHHATDAVTEPKIDVDDELLDDLEALGYLN